MDSIDNILWKDINMPWRGFTHVVYYVVRLVFRTTRWSMCFSFDR